jgi:hypothetical protein
MTGIAHAEKHARQRHFGIRRRLIQIPRQVYQNLQLLAIWQIYDNATFHQNADKTVTDPIDRFQKSPRTAGQNTPQQLALLTKCSGDF